MAKIDLNCDLGESFGAYTIGMDDQVILGHHRAIDLFCSV